jgi:hypothetical protein
MRTWSRHVPSLFGGLGGLITVVLTVILLCLRESVVLGEQPQSSGNSGNNSWSQLFDPAYTDTQFQQLLKSPQRNNLMQRIYENQFPSNCKDRKGWLLQDFQETGLGTIVSFQVAALLHKAVNAGHVLIIENKRMKPHYFEICDDPGVNGKYECLFQPITKCNPGNTRIAMHFPNTKNVNRGMELNWDEWLLYSAFLTRPSYHMLSLTSRSASSIIDNRAFAGHGTAVHIRQGQPDNGADWARQHKPIWSAPQIVNILKWVSKTRNNNEFVVISDNLTLTQSVFEAGNAKAENNQLSVFITSNAVKHIDSVHDCVREKGLGCDERVGAVAVAKSVMIDLVMASRSDRIIGSMESTYAWLLMGMIAQYRGSMIQPEDIMDLDNPQCAIIASSKDGDAATGNCNFRHHTWLPFGHPTPPEKTGTPVAMPTQPPSSSANPSNQPAITAGVTVSVPVVARSPAVVTPDETEGKNLLQVPHPVVDLSHTTVVFEATEGCSFCKLVNDNVLLQKVWLNQFPQSCADRRGVVVEDVQPTGLGTVIGFQLAALLSLALKHNMVLIMGDKQLSSPYFRACNADNPLRGKFECLFQPISNCTEQTIGRVAHRFTTTATANDEVHHSWQEWVLLGAFLARPSESMVTLTSSNLPAILLASKSVRPLSSLSGHGVATHIRQGTRTGMDLVTKHKTVWTGSHLLNLLDLAASKFSNDEFIVISDSPKLTDELLATYNPGIGKEKLSIVVTSKSIVHASSSNDCVRENFLGCDQSIGEERVAKSVLIDLLVAARNDKLVASIDSTFAWLLMGLMSAHKGALMQLSDIIDLDNPSCRAENLQNALTSGGCNFRHDTWPPFTHPTSDPRKSKNHHRLR